MAREIRTTRPRDGTALARAATTVRATVFAGGVVGFLAGGVGGRLAMLLLRITSPDSVVGLESDDGFVIGRITLGNTIGLLAVGTAFGILGGFAYRAVAPVLIGPLWFKRVTVSGAVGVVVGSMLVHTDGVDFTRLEPAGLAVALFVAIPAAYGAAIGAVMDRVDASGGWFNAGRWRPWILAGAVLAGAFFVAPFIGIALVVITVWEFAKDGPSIARLRTSAVVRNGLRAGWAAAAVLGLIALIGDTVTLL